MEPRGPGRIAAIEARVYAEDPARGFLPQAGRITASREPEMPGVRVDSGVGEESDVPVHYDPLLAKLVVWGETRDVAIVRMARALRELVVVGGVVVVVVGGAVVVVVVDDERAVGAEQLHAVRLSLRRIMRRQAVAHAEIDDRAVGERHHRPRHVVDVVPRGLEHDAFASARDDFHRRRAFEVPAHEIDVVGEHVEHGRCVRVAFENGERLRARVVNARRAADDSPQPAVPHLLFCAQKALLESAAVADAQDSARLLQAAPVGDGYPTSPSGPPIVFATGGLP